MTLLELVQAHPQPATAGVPAWMLGFFKRHHISFADGTTDLCTHVCWLQSRNFTIDLRLPLEAQQVPALPLAQYTPEQIQVLANYEAWLADSVWDGGILAWRDTTDSLQLHNRWPEPARLLRTGNCMIEFSPSNAYVEDWRLQPSLPGPLIGLRLLAETTLDTGAVRHRGGGLIVCGDYAALVLGRAEPLGPGAGSLAQRAAQARGDVRQLRQLLGFEASVAVGDAAQGYTVIHSTRPQRLGQDLFPLDGFAPVPGSGHLRQELQVDGLRCERIFAIDTLEPRVEFPLATGFGPDAQAWYAREAATLQRYTEVLR